MWTDIFKNIPANNRLCDTAAVIVFYYEAYARLFGDRPFAFFTLVNSLIDHFYTFDQILRMEPPAECSKCNNPEHCQHYITKNFDAVASFIVMLGLKWSNRIFIIAQRLFRMAVRDGRTHCKLVYKRYRLRYFMVRGRRQVIHELRKFMLARRYKRRFYPKLKALKKFRYVPIVPERFMFGSNCACICGPQNYPESPVFEGNSVNAEFQTNQPPTVNQPIHPPTVNQPIHPPTVNQPIHPPTVNQQIHPPTVNPPNHPPTVNQPNHPPTVSQPIHPPTVNQPNHPPTVNQPIHPPTVNQPNHPPTVNQPNHPPAVNQQIHLNTVNQLIHLPTVNQPVYPSTPIQPNFLPPVVQPGYPSIPVQPIYPSIPLEPIFPSPPIQHIYSPSVTQPFYPNTKIQPVYRSRVFKPTYTFSTPRNKYNHRK